jgi:ankyrin repeat protein
LLQVHNPHQELQNLLPNSSKTPLHYAAEQGTENGGKELVAAVMTQGPEDPWMTMLLQQDEEGRTPLHIAAERRAPDEGFIFKGMVKMLTRRASDDDLTATRVVGLLQLRDKHGRTLLHSAAAAQSLGKAFASPLAAAVMRQFLKLAEASTARIRAAAIEFVPAEIQSLLTAQDQDDCTPLWLAAATGCIGSVKVLFNAADAATQQTMLTLRDSSQRTPLHAAAMHGHDEVAANLYSRLVMDAAVRAKAMLLEDADVNGRTALHYAAWGGHANVLRMFHDMVQHAPPGAHAAMTRLPLQCSTDGTSVFMAAVASGVPEAVEEVLSWSGISWRDELERTTAEGWTVWHFAGRAAATDGAKPGVNSLGVLKRLLELAGSSDTDFAAGNFTGVHEQCTLGRGMAPLAVAALHGQQKVVKWWVEHGGSVVRKMDALGRTALHEAARRGDLAAVAVMVDAVARLEGKDSVWGHVTAHSLDGTSVLMDAVGSGSPDVLRKLLEHCPAVLEANVAAATTVAAAAEAARATATAAESGKMLLMGRDKERWTLWHFAGCCRASQDNLETAVVGESVEVVDMLLAMARECDVDIRAALNSKTCQDGWTPLMVAAHHGNHKVMYDLLHSGVAATVDTYRVVHGVIAWVSALCRHRLVRSHTFTTRNQVESRMLVSALLPG